MAKKVRTIAQKLNDIAEAGWESGDLHADGDDYGQIGDKADRRIARLTKQMEALALTAIQAVYMFSSTRMAEILNSPERDEILAEAVVGNWNAVADLCNTVHFNASHAVPATLPAALVDPLTGQSIALEPREAPGTTSPLHFPCCGGLKPAHTSHCRVQ